MKQKQDFSFLKEFGNVFCVFDQNDSGVEFEQMQAAYPFMIKLFEVTVESAKQLL